MVERWKVVGVQMDVVFADPERNLARMCDHIERAAALDANLVVFPECALAGYCFESREEAWQYAEPVPGPSCQRMTEVCRQHQLHCVFGLLEADDSRLFNACVLVGPDGVVGSYRKIHLPYLGVDRFTTPGDRPFAVFDAGGVRVGLNICYDAAFPESSRIMALEGAELIVLPTNWPPGAQCTADYVINARAMENCVYYMAVNRAGEERGFRFIGRSKICDIHGTTLAQATDESETTILADLDLARARNKRIIRVPELHEIDRFADRRPEMYGRISTAKAD